MMNNKTTPQLILFLPVLMLLALVLAACLPAVAPPATPATPPAVEASATPTSKLDPEQQAATPASIQPAVTPRGPDLVASNPGGVSLASGGLQLVEFIRFT